MSGFVFCKHRPKFMFLNPLDDCTIDRSRAFKIEIPKLNNLDSDGDLRVTSDTWKTGESISDCVRDASRNRVTFGDEGIFIQSLCGQG